MFFNHLTRERGVRQQRLNPLLTLRVMKEAEKRSQACG